MKINNKLRVLASLVILCGLTGMRDPTRPPDEFLPVNKKDAISTNPLKLGGIFVYPNTRLAIINGQLFTEGSKIGEYVVTTINQDTVELTGPQGAMVTLEIGAAVKRATDNEGQ